MGIWETICKVIEEYDGIDANISHARSIGNSLVKLHDRKSDVTVGFCITKNATEYEVENMARYHAERIRSNTDGLSLAKLELVQQALGFRLETWQKEYILSSGIGYIEGRRTGKTTAHQLKTLLMSQEPLEVYLCDIDLIVDERHNRGYERIYLDDLQKMRDKLAAAGIQVREIKIHKGSRFDEGRGCRFR